MGDKGGKALVEIGSFVLIALAVWMGWQVFRELAADRLPPTMALRISPTSARVLSRAAEGELVARRFDDAAHLARLSLAKAPFNVRALRVVGLTEAEKDQLVRADDILTLAGNWSLRDDPSHAWLVEHRLKRGNYGSAFAHADTLARRREDLYPQVFELFTTAATLDPRAIPPLASLLAAKPRWRDSFVMGLNGTDDGLALAANLAISLQASDDGAFTDRELAGLNTYLMRRGQLAAMSEVRRRLGRPDPELVVVNGEFDPPSAPLPYDWKTFTAPGAVAEILTDDLRPNDSALRVHYDSFGSSILAEQFVQLSPGAYRLSGERRTEIGEADTRLSWTISCVESGALVVDTRTVPMPDESDWRAFSVQFVVPEERCTAQWVRLTPRPGDRRRMTVAWYDKLSISA